MTDEGGSKSPERGTAGPKRKVRPGGTAAVGLRVSPECAAAVRMNYKEAVAALEEWAEEMLGQKTGR